MEPLLKSGNAIVLFDGLDEVNLEDNKRADLIQALNDFVYQYSDCPILLTCRVAATDYSFTQFEYVEMADFDEEQMGRYIDLWFVGDEVKRANCRRSLLEDGTNEAVRELAQVPLLLALLCLVYEERGEFPPNRDEIYDEATRALLVKWDSSRNIARDGVYKQLSLKHKQNMLARIAAETFAESEYFLPEKRVVGLIDAYLQGVPGLEDPDGQWVLQAMEAQHGIFVERARRIHSFSHLTLQEYFTARYIVDNDKRGAVKKLMGYVGDDRWREVFKLTAGMLDDATEFFELYLAAVPALLNNDAQLFELLSWTVRESTQMLVDYRLPALRAFLIYITLDNSLSASDLTRGITWAASSIAYHLDKELASASELAHDLAFAFAQELSPNIKFAQILVQDIDLELSYTSDLASALSLDGALLQITNVAKKNGLTDFAKELDDLSMPGENASWSTFCRFAINFMKVLKRHPDWNPYWQISTVKEGEMLFVNVTKEQIEHFSHYLKANNLLLKCLELAYVPNRQTIEDQLLMPPA